MSEKLVTVGRIVNSHGIRGELKVVPETDFPERFDKGNALIIVDSQNKQTPVTVQTSRLHKNMFILQFDQFSNINDVEKFKGSLLKIEAKEQQPLEEGEYYYHEIIGCKVVTEEGQELGLVSEVLTPGANDVWVVSLPKGKQLLLPVIDDVILDVDIANKTIRIHLMEGLME
ncbi:16S rRNA processing protein RimM [Paenibacillus sp. V4I3]|jgi:16S rRNA processing protein RimM|uniref:ribosome maturation factor RimM n=1 Tax=unclassified Paenibacillus TaxID=185978 RepID=UPI00277E63A9|nr:MULTISPECIES: ribosome maturation factor RimM [unclassified Paenibacillus]MDF2648869.1 rRNA-processing protein RimM [Paenibacillus sp.]MDQ0876467.1 16S rRNA processing protein RimM [Paenibacillus sp. V4I3]MDQ0887499.1 16S rRNA processing protein RimM [Paenibacillus sp. V4I9]MDQ0899840.1 16S rRNA processing protein RimM [Paenibacillus sp. V4I7]